MALNQKALQNKRAAKAEPSTLPAKKLTQRNRVLSPTAVSGGPMCYSKVKMGIALIISLSITPAAGFAEALSPDPSFGSGGKMVTDFFGGLSGFGDGAHAVVVQPDGKLVVAGFATPSNARFSGIQVASARYNLDGTLD
jgi:hypothetical protein